MGAGQSVPGHLVDLITEQDQHEQDPDHLNPSTVEGGPTAVSELQLDNLMHLVSQQDWTTILGLRTEIEQFQGSARERAVALDALGQAEWYLAQTPFDYAQAIRRAREAAHTDDVGGSTIRRLGSRLVTIGRYVEGSRLLQAWLTHFHQWDPEAQRQLGNVQYTLGYAVRYQALYPQAELWYSAALQTYEASDDETWTCYTACALAQVRARMGNPVGARQALSQVPVNAGYEGYRLKAMVEILTVEGDHEAALALGEGAAEALSALDDPDPWELAELHVLLANLQYQAGNLVERDRHLEVVDLVLRQSPRHDLYTQVRLLLDLDGKEVAV